jgi:hypothetical protein
LALLGELTLAYQFGGIPIVEIGELLEELGFVVRSQPGRRLAPGLLAFLFVLPLLLTGQLS